MAHIRYTEGNLLEADTEALVNTVNTVGVMGKGIALMFKERFDLNRELYEKACKARQVEVGKMFVTETGELIGNPKWIVNFPTKKHWRHPSKMEWIVDGLQDLCRFIVDKQVRSIAIPPLGAGNGGLDWPEVKGEIERALSDLDDVDIVIYEPTKKYQNVAKRKGEEKLTPPRALIAELIRAYWILGMECSQLEIQKLAWFLHRAIEREGIANPMNLNFTAGKYGPYAHNLTKLLERMDGSFLKSDKRITDSSKDDVIFFNYALEKRLHVYLESTEPRPFHSALEQALMVINGFESPYGMELLSTVDWLISMENVQPDVDSLMNAIATWPEGPESASRKARLFDRNSVSIALESLQETAWV